jgi:pectinesterase
MAYTARDGSRVMFEPRDARFGEWRSRGPGALRSPTRPRLHADARRAASAARMFGDWNPGDA